MHNVVFWLLRTLQRAHTSSLVSMHRSPVQWTPFTHLAFPSGHHYSVLCIRVCVFVWFIFYIPHNEWNHMAFVFLHQIDFTWYDTLYVCQWFCCKWRDFIPFLWLGACVRACVCVCVCVYHFHQLMGSYFCILAVVNNAAVIIRVHTSFQSSVFVFSGVKLPGHLVALISWETSIVFPIVAASIHIPTDSVGGFPFLNVVKFKGHLVTISSKNTKK